MLKILNYNINRRNTFNNYNSILKFLSTNDYDVIGLQETTDVFYDSLVKSFPNYHIRMVNEVILMVKIQLTPIFIDLSTATAKIIVNNKSVVITTLRLSSPRETFFKDESTDIKCTQLEVVIDSLPQADCQFIIGDFNFVSHAQFDNEVKCIEKHGFIDTFKYTYNLKYAKEDRTYSTFNPRAKEAKNTPNYRLDRILVRSNDVNIDILVLKVIKEITYSDHYPIEGIFKITPFLQTEMSRENRPSIDVILDKCRKESCGPEFWNTLNKNYLTERSNYTKEEIISRLRYIDEVTYVYRRRYARNTHERTLPNGEDAKKYNIDYYRDDTTTDDRYDSGVILINLGSDEIAVENFINEFLVMELPDMAPTLSMYIAKVNNYDPASIKRILNKIKYKELIDYYLGYILGGVHYFTMTPEVKIGANILGKMVYSILPKEAKLIIKELVGDHNRDEYREFYQHNILNDMTLTEKERNNLFV